MIWLWIGFVALICLLLAIDLGVFHRHLHAIKLREAIGWTVLWIGVGLAFTIAIYFIYEHHWFGAHVAEGEGALLEGGEAVMLYLTGYVLEKSLSIDNIFVMAVIFRHFAVAPVYQHRVLYWGILGAIVTRGIMILGGAYLFQRFDWLFYPFGAYLVITGLRLLRPDGGEKDPEKSRIVQWLRRFLPVAGGQHEQRFFVREDGRRKVTLLFVVLLTIELTDVVFAVDSVPAVLAITTNSFIVMTSNVFAILGLRSLYFVLASMIQQFRHLQYSLAAILALIGVKMLLHTVLKIPTVYSLLFVLLALTAGIVASFIRRESRQQPAG
ncbi:MAG: TerC family protein [Deltaproteobacteria bacterium]|nr:TerC family protein [Deltaproteobacteria bacterium]